MFPLQESRSPVWQTEEFQHAGSVFLPVWPCQYRLWHHTTGTSTAPDQTSDTQQDRGLQQGWGDITGRLPLINYSWIVTATEDSDYSHIQMKKTQLVDKNAYHTASSRELLWCNNNAALRCLVGLCKTDYHVDFCLPAQTRLSPQILFTVSAFLSGP